MTTYLQCESCGVRKPDVEERICAFYLEINDQAIAEVVCDDCEQEHRYDI